jgi:hypothetical protein
MPFAIRSNVMANDEEKSEPDLVSLEKLSAWLDNKFALGSFRFGLDPILGLVPVLGDTAGLLTNLVLFKTVWKRGASFAILAKMLGNQLLDVFVGLFPFLGDFFDVLHKAHRKNLKLLQAYYAEPEPKPNVTWALLLFGVLLFGIILSTIWLVGWVWSRIFS